MTPRTPFVFLAIATTRAAMSEFCTWPLRVTTPAEVVTWISLDLMSLPLANAVFTFVVIVVSLSAVAVPTYAFFAAPSVSSPARCIEVLAGTGGLVLGFCARAGIVSPIPRSLSEK